MRLSEAQLRAVQLRGHLLVSAGPGCGKTATMSQRAAALLRENPQHRLAAVTFTKDAVREIETRILGLVPEAGTRLLCGTFHSLNIQQLQAAGRRVVVLSTSQGWQILRSVHASEQLALGSMTVEDMQSEIDKLRCQLVPITPDKTNPIHRALVAYETAVKATGKMDFQDLVRETVLGMQSGKVGPLAVQHLIVDEFQDSDALQVEWVLLHCAAGISTTCCGDDDQSIYGFREGKGYEAIEHFLDYSSATHVKLEMTYRCAPEIVHAAGRLIAKNTERVPKTIRTAKPPGGKITVRRFSNDIEEARGVATAIEAYMQDPPAWKVKDKPPAFSDWAVLARSNRALELVEESLKESAIPARRVGAKPYWEHPGPALLLEGMSMLATGDRAHMEVLLRATGVSERAIDRVKDAVSDARTPLAGLLALRPPIGDSLDAVRIRDLRQYAGEWMAQVHKGNYKRAAMGVGAFLTERCDKKTLGYRSLDAGAATFERLTGTLSQRLATLQRSEADGDSQNKVALLTLHGSKGLEFDCVWIVRTEEGVLPMKGSDLSEERRLMYVGMTRARQHLVLSRTVGSSSRPRVPSTFLEEAGVMRAEASLTTSQ